jgi:hypothetical protein
MPKFTVTKVNDTSFEVEADTFQDAGHEGRWIDFGGKVAGSWIHVLRVRSADVKKIERKD